MNISQIYNSSTQTGDCNVPSKVLREEVKEFANKANSLVKQVIGITHIAECPGPVGIYNPIYTPIPYYPSPRPIFISPRGGVDHPPSSRKKSDESNFALGVIATVAGLVVLYSIGSGIGTYQDAAYEAEDAEYFINHLNSPSRTYSRDDSALIEEAKRAAELKGRISDRIKSSALKDVAFRVTALTGVSTLATGAYLGIPVAVTAGAVTSVAALAGIVFKWGLNSSQRANERDAEALQYSLSRLDTL